jgi:glycosyltransferase involved in cell wall biosynthesis
MISMKEQIKILVNTPDINKIGGVANFYKGLNGKFTLDVKYNYIGGSSQSRFSSICFLRDYLIFIFKLIKIRPDIVHINPSLDKKAVIRDSLFLIVSRMFGKKVLVSWHGWNEKYQDVIDLKYKSRFSKIFNKAQAFTVLCSDFKNKLEEWGISKPVYLETTMFDDMLIEHFDITKKEYNGGILFFSRVEKEKGIYLALDAYSMLKDQNVHFVIAGTGTELERVKAYVNAKSIPNVKFTGYVTGKDKALCLKENNIYVLLSETEGMPISTLEAMAFGLAVVTTPVGGIKDLFINGTMGYMTDSKNPKDYADIFDKLLKDKNKLKEISEYNHYYAVSKFKASNVAARLEIIYLKLHQQK